MSELRGNMLPGPLADNLPFLLTLLIILVAVVLFVKEYFTIDVTAILIMTLFIVSGVLAPEEGFAGFTNPATITVACMFVLSFALFRSGILDPLIRLLIRVGRWHFLSALALLMLLSAVLSAFINDTAVVALMMPAALRLADRTGISPSKLLMPLSFAALLGGICTLIGTSTNILVSGIIAQQGHAPLGMFELTSAAIWISLAGIAFLMLTGPFLLPSRSGIRTTTSTTDFVAKIRLEAGARDIGRRIGGSQLVKEQEGEILSFRRRHGPEDEPFTEGSLMAEGDELKIVLGRDRLRELRKMPGIRLLTERQEPGDRQDVRLYEVVVPLGSQLVGMSTGSRAFLTHLEHGVIGVRRNDRMITGDPEHTPLVEGDILLLATTPGNMFRLSEHDALTIINEYENKALDVRKAVTAIVILAGVIALPTLGIAPIVMSAMVGVLALLVARVIDPEEAYRAVEWKVIFLLAGVLSMGAALQKTGGDQLIAESLRNLLGGSPPTVALAVVFGITFLTTNVMSNNATAALMTPIVLQLAPALQVSERPFIIAVTFAASLAFMTPMGYQTNSMIYVPGNYRFNDYLRVGTPLNILVWIVAVWVIPRYFPF
jgi:di/tricarboxylate transporter